VTSRRLLIEAAALARIEALAGASSGEDRRSQMTISEKAGVPVAADAGHELKAATRAAWALGDYHRFAKETIWELEHSLVFAYVGGGHFSDQIIENQVRNAIRTLVERGWLRPLVARGWYEFLPARGGPYPSGDPLIVARAVRRKRPDLRLAVVGTGAAFLRGFSERGPRRYVVAVDHAQGGSVAVAREYDVVKTTLARLEGIPEFGDVPVSDAAHLLADVALWPAACGDLRNGDHWLRRALAAAAPATGQQARSLPERLMIGPDEYLKATRIEDRGSRIGDRGLEIEDWRSRIGRSKIFRGLVSDAQRHSSCFGAFL